MTDWPDALARMEAEVAGCDDIRPCPECAGTGLVELSHGHCPYLGEIVSTDICPECDGTGEITVTPIEQEDLPA